MQSVIVYEYHGQERSIKGRIEAEDDLFITISDSYGTRIRIRRTDILKVVEKPGVTE